MQQKKRGNRKRPHGQSVKLEWNTPGLEDQGSFLTMQTGGRKNKRHRDEGRLTSYQNKGIMCKGTQTKLVETEPKNLM